MKSEKNISSLISAKDLAANLAWLASFDPSSSTERHLMLSSNCDEIDFNEDKNSFFDIVPVS